MNKLMALAAGLLALAFAVAGQAQGVGPDALVKSTVDEVLAMCRQTKDQNTLVDLAEKKVLANFDFKQMTRLAVGRSWAQASPAQQEALERAFRTLLVRTYTTALAQISGDYTVEVKPTIFKQGDVETMVKTLVREAGRKPLMMDYRMISTPEGWKVYDVVVEKLSLVTNYRSSFQSEIYRSGIDGLIRVIESKNLKSEG